MTVTAKRRTFDANWAWGPVGSRKRLMIELREDARALSEIAADFEGAQEIEVRDEHEGNALYTGYTRLVRIERTENGGVQLALEREETA